MRPLAQRPYETVTACQAKSHTLAMQRMMHPHLLTVAGAVRALLADAWALLQRMHASAPGSRLPLAASHTGSAQAPETGQYATRGMTTQPIRDARVPIIATTFRWLLRLLYGLLLQANIS